MKPIYNLKRFFICPHHHSCKTHQFITTRDGKLCGHHIPHSLENLCLAPECNDMPNAQCIPITEEEYEASNE